MNEKAVDVARRRFLTALTTLMCAVGVVFAAIPFIAFMKPSARAKAVGGPVEVDISKLKPRELMVEKWRGKPVWILRRSEETLAALPSLDDQLVDPESEEAQQPEYAKNEYRSIAPEYLVVIGLCTHLGCSPKLVPPGAGRDLGSHWPGGFVCPCHGSQFDLAGRVFKGWPAPANLVVPPYRYLDKTRLLIGEDRVII
ncbi:MAG: ubiquinol-cytochrome c reductase iron-sulfur subunit [Gammaproteobacteria bacterium]|nr:ubiquinol-cytochrome c reductase iron-sulfur subunit [Gammaproteobacteria bacterium]